jgi:hypothetical protein
MSTRDFELLAKDNARNVAILEEKIALEKRHGSNVLLVSTLNGHEREYLRSIGCQCRSVEPTHCEITWK